MICFFKDSTFPLIFCTRWSNAARKKFQLFPSADHVLKCDDFSTNSSHICLSAELAHSSPLYPTLGHTKGVIVLWWDIMAKKKMRGAKNDSNFWRFCIAGAGREVYIFIFLISRVGAVLKLWPGHRQPWTGSLHFCTTNFCVFFLSCKLFFLPYGK